MSVGPHLSACWRQGLWFGFHCSARISGSQASKDSLVSAFHIGWITDAVHLIFIWVLRILA